MALGDVEPGLLRSNNLNHHSDGGGPGGDCKTALDLTWPGGLPPTHIRVITGGKTQVLVDIDFPRGPLTAVETWDVATVCTLYS